MHGIELKKSSICDKKVLEKTAIKTSAIFSSSSHNFLASSLFWRRMDNTPSIRVEKFSHLILLLGLEGDVGSLHQSVLGTVLVDALGLGQHLVLLIVCRIEKVKVGNKQKSLSIGEN